MSDESRPDKLPQLQMSLITQKQSYSAQESCNSSLQTLLSFVWRVPSSEIQRPSLWSSWLQIQRPGFDSGRYHIFWEVLSLERGSLGLVSTIEELLERNSSGSGLEIQDYGRGDPSLWPRGTLYPRKLALTSPTSCGLSVGIVSLWI
jgi:hypothetical protein